MFLSSYENKLDKKGRVSVPATFRTHLSSMGYNGFICYPSFNHSALEACSQERIEKLSDTIDTLNPFEEKRDFLATSILSESVQFQFDTEGRISLTEKLLNHAKIKNNILFVGLGKTFIAGDILNEYRERRQRCLLICPAALRDSTWKQFQSDFEMYIETHSFQMC